MITVASPEEMVALGEHLGRSLGGGDVIALVGPLGAGKTTLVRGIGQGLDITQRVSSPTFVLARRHPGPRVDLLHCDAYRVSDSDEFVDLALETDDCVTVVEWGAAFVSELTDDWLEISIDRGVGLGDDARTMVVTPHGSRWSARAGNLPAAWSSGLAKEPDAARD